MAADGGTPCGCCEGIAPLTPRATYQRPGLSAISARSGDYWSFRDTMTARLTSADYGTLADLRTRDARSDGSIATIDAWAVGADILTFYHERLLSETLLPTAGELWSLHQLAGLVSYRPHPGVSAETDLAFTLAATEGAPRKITLPSGVKVQSTPGPDESPVIFETSQSVEARPAWNAMRPRQYESQTLEATTTRLWLSGTTTGLQPGDGLFFIADDTTPVFAIIREVAVTVANPFLDPDSVDMTKLVIEPTSTAPLAQNATEPTAPTSPVFPPAIVPYLGTTVTAGELTELLDDAGLTEEDLFDPLEGAPETPQRILVFRQHSGVFGNAAPAISSLPPALTGDVPVYDIDDQGDVFIKTFDDAPYKGVTAAEWADGDLTVLAGSENAVYLDRTFQDIAAGGFVVLKDGSNWATYQLETVADVSLSRFTISAKVTKLLLNGDTGFGTFTTRGTIVFAASDWIDLPNRPKRSALRAGATNIVLNTWAPGLQPGQHMALTGIYADDLNAPVTRMVELAEVEHQLFAGGRTRVTLAAALTDDFDRQALRINGNIAPANHGESTTEVLAAGQTAQPFLQVGTKQKPLTHVTAPVPGGAQAAAELRVGGILWHPVDNLLDAASHDRVYTTTIDPEGIATFGFGNGIMGAMPNAGPEGITLSYRTGLGLGGRVDAGQLNILMTRPLGVEGVANPLPSEGGADPEPLDALRQNVPLSCRTLDRVVSLDDFADFARAYGGIAKARAEWVRFPGAAKAGVVVTVAGEEAAEVPPGSTLYDNLNAALRDSGIPYTRFRLRGYRPRYFHMAAKVKPLSDYLPDDVMAAVETALRTAYDFASRSFAAPVFASEVIATMQQVPGVEAVVLDSLYLGATVARNDALLAETASVTNGAELLMLHPGPLDYLEVLS